MEIISFLNFLGDKNIPLNGMSFQVIHIGLLAVAIVFFGLHNDKENLEEKTQRCRSFINKNIKNIKKNKDKLDLLNSQLNEYHSGIQNMLKNIVYSFKYLLAINIISLIFLVIEELYPINIFSLIIYFLTAIAFWITYINSYRFCKIYSYDPEKYVKKINNGMLDVDNKKYNILLQPRESFNFEEPKSPKLSELLNPYK